MSPTITVSRYEPAPYDEPKHYVVGFRVQVGSREVYFEGLVPLPEAAGKTEREVAELAYASIRQDVEERVERMRNEPSLVGQTFETEEMQTARRQLEDEGASREQREDQARVESQTAIRAAQDASLAETAAALAAGEKEGEVSPGDKPPETTNGESERSGEERDDDDGSTPRRRRRRSPNAPE